MKIHGQSAHPDFEAEKNDDDIGYGEVAGPNSTDGDVDNVDDDEEVALVQIIVVVQREFRKVHHQPMNAGGADITYLLSPVMMIRVIDEDEKSWV